MSRAQENYLNKIKARQQQQVSIPFQYSVVPPAGVLHGVPVPLQGLPVPLQGVPVPLQGAPVEEQVDPERVKNVLPIYGNATTFNINTLLYNNILEADYFKALYQLRTYHEIVDEIYPSVSHVAPWQTGTTRIPSTAFCLLLKFFLMRLTVKQMKGLLHTDDCPFVRAIGFLYLRYSCPPSELWDWFEPFLEDEEEFTPSTDPTLVMTIGEYLIQLLTDMKYFGTTLPRIPVLYERKFQVMLLLLKERQKRRRKNMHDLERGRFCNGAKVMAIYQDEVNEPAWYEAVIQSRDTQDGMPASLNKFWVKFTDYGNTESVDLGDMKLVDESDSRTGDNEDRDRNRSRGESRDRDRGRERSRNSDGDDDGEDKDFLAKVLQKQRDSSVAVGKNYASRPVSYKSSLSLKMTTYTARKKSPTREYRSDRRRSQSRSRSRDRGRDRERDRYRERDRERDRDRDRRDLKRRDERSSRDENDGCMKSRSSKEQAERMRKLRETYGDASAPK